MNKPTLKLSVLGTLLASLALVACSPRDEEVAAPAAGNNDAVVARSDAPATAAERQMDRATESARDAARQAGDATRSAVDSAGNKVADAVITTSVNAELAKDKSLSATKIDVDTEAGRVSLHGTAPNEAARERATQLAAGVKGVVSVDNQLSVAPN